MFYGTGPGVFSTARLMFAGKTGAHPSGTIKWNATLRVGSRPCLQISDKGGKD